MSFRIELRLASNELLFTQSLLNGIYMSMSFRHSALDLFRTLNWKGYSCWPGGSVYWFFDEAWKISGVGKTVKTL